jgi:hypothetical protein
VVFVSSTALDDAVAAPQVRQHLGLETYPRWEGMWADNKDHKHGLNAWIKTEAPGNWRLAGVRRPEGSKGFVLLPRQTQANRCGGSGPCTSCSSTSNPPMSIRRAAAAFCYNAWCTSAAVSEKNPLGTIAASLDRRDIIEALGTMRT